MLREYFFVIQQKIKLNEQLCGEHIKRLYYARN